MYKPVLVLLMFVIFLQNSNSQQNVSDLLESGKKKQQEKKLAEAIDDFTKAIKLDPSNHKWTSRRLFRSMHVTTCAK
jgi:hypothetical protein